MKKFYAIVKTPHTPVWKLAAVDGVVMSFDTAEEAAERGLALTRAEASAHTTATQRRLLLDSWGRRLPTIAEYAEKTRELYDR